MAARIRGCCKSGDGSCFKTQGRFITSSPPSQISVLGCWVATSRAGPGEEAYELGVGSRAGQAVNPGALQCSGQARWQREARGRGTICCGEQRSELKIPCPFAFLCCVIDCAHQLGSAPSQPPSTTAAPCAAAPHVGASSAPLPQVLRVGRH